MSRDGQMDIDSQRSPIVLPPPSSLEGYRTALPLYAQPPPHAPQRWETKSGSSSSALPSLPSIHSMSRSSSPTTMLPTPVSLPGALTASTSYFSHRDHDREYQAAMREREIKEREREEHRTLRYPSPRVKYERSLSPQLHPSHMQQQQQQQHHHGMPMTMAPPVDPRYYPAHAYRDRGLSDAAIQRMAQEEKDQSVGQTRRLAHLMSEQKRRESINSGFAALRTALPTCHPTDSKAVVLRKAVSRIQQLEQMLGQESSQRYNDHSPNSPEIDNHARDRAGPSERRYNDWEEKPSFDDHPRSHGRPHSQSVSQVQLQASGPAPPNRRQHSHSHSHSESISYPRSVASDNSNGENGENKRGREGQLWQDEPMGNRRRLS